VKEAVSCPAVCDQEGSSDISEKTVKKPKENILLYS